MAKIENDETPEFGHADFLQIGYRKTSIPLNAFEWDHLQNSLPFEERVQSKWREKLYRERKWN